MTCGIYKLTFSSGNFYIGKSIDIDKRWKQHFEAMQKGKHTKLLQQEYNRYGYPKAEILVECHADHIDIVEESYIARMGPPLNSTYPTDRMAGVADSVWSIVLDYFKKSTLEHIQWIDNLRTAELEYKENISVLEKKIDANTSTISTLKKQRSQEEIALDIEKRILTIQKQLASVKKEARLYKSNLESVIKQFNDYKNLPWWKKIFN
jgi:group I intron endonuclease